MLHRYNKIVCSRYSKHNFDLFYGQVAFSFGQVCFITTCPMGQVGKIVNVEPWAPPPPHLSKKMFGAYYNFNLS